MDMTLTIMWLASSSDNRQKQEKKKVLLLYKTLNIELTNVLYYSFIYTSITIES